MRFVLTWLLLSPLCTLAQAPVVPPSPKPDDPLQTAGERPIDIEHIRLDLNVDLEKQTVRAKATIDFRYFRPIAAIPLDAVGFQVQEVQLQPAGQPAMPVTYWHDDAKLTIDLPPEAKPTADAKATLIVKYLVRQPKEGLYFFKPTKAEPNIPYMVWSQGEAITNRYWIPCIDHPDEMQTTEMVVTAPQGFEVLSNGRLLSRKVNADRTETFHWKQEKPHVSYLITLVVGKFAVVQEDWKGLPVLYYVPPERKDDVARTFGRTREMLDFFSRRFGIDYPWEKYAQVTVEQFTGGGMENTSATTLTDRALHDERAFLDSDSDGLIAHELGHQWWGDLVTCRDWAHLWLNEGFASFCEVIWAEHHQGKEEGAYLLVGKARAAIAGGKERPIVDRRYTSPRMMFDARAYPKGAWVLQMLRAKLGEELFWKGIRVYGTEHKHQSVETSDLRRTLERVSGINLERFFYDWTERPGHPVLELTTQYLADTKQVRFAVKQTQPGEAFHFTLPIRLTLAQGMSAEKPTRTETLEVRDKEQVFFLRVDEPVVMVEVDPDQTVLAEFHEKHGRDLWANQLLKSKSISCRVRAAKHFGQSKSIADQELLVQAFRSETHWGVATEIAAALGDSGGEVCRDALMEGTKHGHPKIRRACVTQLAKFIGDAKAIAAVRAILQKGDPSYFVEASALSTYAKLQPKDVVETLLPWLARASHNDVIRSAALTGLGESGSLDALDTLISWTQRGKTRSARIAALAALATLSKKASLTEAQRKPVLSAIVAVAQGEGEMPAVRRAAVDALREMGQAAASQLDVLEAIRLHDTDEFVQNLARRAIEQIRGNAPVPTEVNRLREELERLRKSNQQLQERLDRWERERKGS